MLFGGRDDEWNLRALCASCNLAKAARSPVVLSDGGTGEAAESELPHTLGYLTRSASR